MPNLREALENSKRPSFIRGLRIEEISGVDHPAHEVEGWTVMKARDRAKKMGNIGLWKGLIGDYAVVAKSVNKERRYTLGLLYAASNPGEVVADAHGESISESDLYAASLNYVKTGDRSIHLQHGDTELGLTKIGEWVHLMQWPNAVTEEFKLPGNKMATKVTIPANSVWVGIEWDELGWSLVKEGQLRGLSLGGFQRKKATEEKTMTKSKPSKDPLEGYVGASWETKEESTEKAATPAKSPTDGFAQPWRAQMESLAKATPPVEQVDHKPRLDQRLEEFLASFEASLGAERYKAMLLVLIEFAALQAKAELQQDHEKNALWLADQLKKILISEHDQVSVLSKYVGAQTLKGFRTDKTVLGDLMADLLHRVRSQSVEQDLEDIDFKAQTKRDQDSRDRRKRSEGI